jgi:hypothetical protein
MAFATYVLGDKWFLDQFVAQMILLWANALGCGCRKCHPCRSCGMPALMEDAAQSGRADLAVEFPGRYASCHCARRVTFVSRSSQPLRAHGTFPCAIASSIVAAALGRTGQNRSTVLPAA